jgi:hypothetical protein
MTYVIWWLSSFNLRPVAQTRIFIGFYRRPKFVCLLCWQLCLCFGRPTVDLLNVTSWEVYLSYKRSRYKVYLWWLNLRSWMLSMTIVRDFGSRWRLLNMIWILFTCCTIDRSPGGLRHVNRARRSTSTTLFRVHQERELFAPLYSAR